MAGWSSQLIQFRIATAAQMIEPGTNPHWLVKIAHPSQSTSPATITRNAHRRRFPTCQSANNGTIPSTHDQYHSNPVTANIAAPSPAHTRPTH